MQHCLLSETLSASPHRPHAPCPNKQIALYPHSIQNHYVCIILPCCSFSISEDTGRINSLSIVYHLWNLNSNAILYFFPTTNPATANFSSLSLCHLEWKFLYKQIIPHLVIQRMLMYLPTAFSKVPNTVSAGRKVDAHLQSYFFFETISLPCNNYFRLLTPRYILNISFVCYL